MNISEIVERYGELTNRVRNITADKDWDLDPEVTEDLMFLAYELGLRDGPKGSWYLVHGSEPGRFSMFSHLAYADKVRRNEGLYKRESRQPGCNRRLAKYCKSVLMNCLKYKMNLETCNFPALRDRAAIEASQVK